MHTGAVLLVFLAASDSSSFVSVSCVNGVHLYCLLGNSQHKQTGNIPLDNIPMLTLYWSTDHGKHPVAWGLLLYSCPSTERRAEKSRYFH